MNLDTQTYFPGVNIQKSMTHSLVRGKFCDIVSGKATRLKFCIRYAFRAITIHAKLHFNQLLLTVKHCLFMTTFGTELWFDETLSMV